MTTLSPSSTATLAADIYGIKKTTNPKLVFLTTKTSLIDMQKFHVLSGRSGVSHIQSNFGAIVQASSKGKHANDTIIAIRGTIPTWIFDISTDLFCGLRTDDCGHLIHAGFERTFNSIWPQVEAYLRKSPCRGEIHVVGHSLGGALATLIANAIKFQFQSRVKLYTFGAPRVGQHVHASKITSELKPENIFRVHHHNDPVAMVPTWPFVHAPLPGTEYCLANSGLAVNPLAHSMGKYVDTLAGRNSWDNLQRSYQNWYKANDNELMRYLENHTDMGISMRSMFMLESAIRMVVRKALLSTSFAGTSVAIGSFTSLDQMFMSLASAANVSKDIGGSVTSLLAKMLRYAGIPMKKGQEITYSFVKWVFGKFQATLIRLAGLAIRNNDLAA